MRDTVTIVNVGVNAVSEEFMKEIWEEIIGPIRNWMSDHPPGIRTGYMLYPMWTFYEEPISDVLCQREKSFEFGWTDWPPKYLDN